MRRILILLAAFLLAAFLLAACSSETFKGWYESFKAQHDAKRTPIEREVSPIPSYDEYQKEREQKK